MNSILTFLAFCGVVLLSCVEAEPTFTTTLSCPDTFTIRDAGDPDKGCYVTSSAVANWETARAACVTLGGYLVKMDDQDENDYVSGLSDPTIDFYFGLNDIAVDSTFAYTDVADTSVPFTTWKLFEPTGISGGLQAENCGIVTTNAKWNDVECSLEYMYVCEADVITTTTLDCNEGWVSNSDDAESINACYQVNSDAMNYETAVSTCAAIEGASLYYPTTDAENTYVTGQVNADYWVDMTDTTLEGTFVTSTGTALTYFNWAWLEPNNALFQFWLQEDCAVARSNGQGNDVSCDSTFPFVCKYTP